MSFLLHLPIRRKLSVISMLSSGMALILACAAIVIYEEAVFREEMRRDFAILADMFDDNAAPGLAFNDSSSLDHVLKTLAAHPHIVAACIYDRSAKVVASYQRTEHPPDFPFPPAQPSGSRFLPDRLEVFKDISPAGEWIGTFYAAVDLTELDVRLKRYGAIVCLVFSASVLVALILSSRLQGVISEPIVSLARIARTVAHEKNYSLRATKYGNDELGQLIDGFNEMLTEIQTRDSALQEARLNLEKRVAERTADLSRENSERRRSEAALLDSQRFLQSTLDALSAHLAILDEQGTIIAVNALWETFSQEHPFLTDARRAGANYLNQCDKAGREGIGYAEAIANGIRRVIARTSEEYELEFPGCNGPAAPWYRVRATRFAGADPVRVVVAHEDISARKKAEADLEQSNRQLVLASRMAGMAEVATGVLHNVGNVLNSVNVSATIISDTLRRTRLGFLSKSVSLLQQHEQDLGTFLTTDPKGQKLPGFLDLLAQQLTQEQSCVLRELDQLRKNLEHIKDIVAMQQSYARVSGVSETLPVRELVEDTLRMNDGALTRHNIEVVREFEANPTLNIDKHKVLQILINLMRNAKYACDASPLPDKRIVVRITQREDRVAISIVDNGIGIPPENLTRIFGHGFTTKKDGHGFGLHSGALAAKEMGGSLTVHSEGVGKGATFTLEIPLHPMRAAA